jgi:hypothetical protein
VKRAIDNRWVRRAQRRALEEVILTMSISVVSVANQSLLFKQHALS